MSEQTGENEPNSSSVEEEKFMPHPREEAKPLGLPPFSRRASAVPEQPPPQHAIPKLMRVASMFTRRGSLFPARGEQGGDAPVNPKIEIFRKAVRNVQMRRRMASFFGVDEATEPQEKKLWERRRQRFATRTYGELKPECRASVEVPEEPVEGFRREKQSVALMTIAGVSQFMATLKKRQTSGAGAHQDYPMQLIDEGPCGSQQADFSSRSYVSFPSFTSEIDDDVFKLDNEKQHYGKDKWKALSNARGRLLKDPNRDSIKPEAGSEPQPSKLSRWKGIRERALSTSSQVKRGRAFLGKFISKSDIKRKPLAPVEDIDDSRPFFTYWVTTVQILILIISVACYGFGPIGLSTLEKRSGLVLTSSLSLQQVNYEEPFNLYWGPRAADLIHLGAKFAPCMRRDAKIVEEIELGRSKERGTACCIRNDESGCVQTSEEECSEVISTWKKWSGDATTLGRTSGSVCGLDPRFCEAPASVAPFEWDDDITKWPVCTKTGAIPHDKFGVEHMNCEIIGHPCCIGIHATCQITTREYCDFVRGHFHEEAFLCSQVSCLNDVCGMIPFFNPDYPDQFYRLFTSLFLHAGFAHLMVTICVQWFLMRDLEKLTGTFRIMVIYLGSGIGGNLASAVFLPYRADVGPTGSQFGLLACLIAEVLNMWSVLRHPWRALSKLLVITGLLLLVGLLPWVDNFSHIFGLIFGFLLSYALLPFITIGQYDRYKKIKGIVLCLIGATALVILLICLFYVIPVYDCQICDTLNCIPIWPDFCANQNINFKRTKSLL